MSRASSHRPGLRCSARQPVRCVPRCTESLFPYGKRLYFSRHPQAIPRGTLPLMGSVGRRSAFLSRSDSGQPWRTNHGAAPPRIRHPRHTVPSGIRTHPEWTSHRGKLPWAHLVSINDVLRHVSIYFMCQIFVVYLLLHIFGTSIHMYDWLI